MAGSALHYCYTPLHQNIICADTAIAALPATVDALPPFLTRLRTTLHTLNATLTLAKPSLDALAPVAGATMVHERAASGDKTLKLYEGLYHEILNEPERQTVLDDLLSWLDDRSASSPASR